MQDHRIETLEQLRAIVGESNPATQYKIFSTIEDTARAFIARSPFVVLATSDANGNQDVSPKGDPPGFVEVESDTTLLIPDRKGNKLIFGLQNVLANPHIGVLFLLPGTGETLRVNGRAELTADPDVLARLSARGQPAQLAIRVHVEECFFHCAKAFLRAQLWKPETWAPLRVSFGKILATRLGGDAQVVEAIDKLIDEDYATNL
jgi:PPOX class probable FMN-dependent enzyme